VLRRPVEIPASDQYRRFPSYSASIASQISSTRATEPMRKLGTLPARYISPRVSTSDQEVKHSTSRAGISAYRHDLPRVFR